MAVCIRFGKGHIERARIPVSDHELTRGAIVLVRIFTLLACLIAVSMARADNWPAWRGIRTDGTSAESQFPIKWSAKENIAWKAPIPGVGHSSPIIWGDRVFLTSCVESTRDRLLICLDRKNGAIVWKQVVVNAPLEGKHSLNSFASSTPATDGERVWVTFFDKPRIRVACYDFNGKLLWMKSPGEFNSKHGFCSSPILDGDRLIVNCDQDDQEAFIVALDKRTGEELWRADRPNRTRSYCPPILIDAGGKKQLVLSGSKCVASYDPATGKQNWIIHGPTEQYVAGLVYDQGIVFLTCGFPTKHLVGIDPTGSGDVTKTHIRWHETKNASYVPSPVAQSGLFFVVSDEGMGSCFEPTTGKRHWMERLGKRHSASLVAAGGYVYFLDDYGNCFVVKADKSFTQVARNELGETTYASPALSDGQIFIRTTSHLYCIGKK